MGSCGREDKKTGCENGGTQRFARVLWRGARARWFCRDEVESAITLQKHRSSAKDAAGDALQPFAAQGKHLWI